MKSASFWGNKNVLYMFGSIVLMWFIIGYPIFGWMINVGKYTYGSNTAKYYLSPRQITNSQRTKFRCSDSTALRVLYDRDTAGRDRETGQPMSDSDRESERVFFRTHFSPIEEEVFPQRRIFGRRFRRRMLICTFEVGFELALVVHSWGRWRISNSVLGPVV